MNISSVLNKYLVDVRLRPHNEGIAWLVSRIASRQAQERIIRHWNRHSALPSNVEGLPRFSPGVTPARRLEAL